MINTNPWGRAHSSLGDLISREAAEIILPRYAQTARWADYDLKVGECTSGKFCILARLKETHT